MSRTSSIGGTHALYSEPAGPATPPVDASEPLLPAPSISGLGSSAMEELAVLLTRADAHDRTQARALEKTADASAAKDDAAHVQSMFDAADSDRDAAEWTGVGQIFAGVATGVSGIFPDDSKSNGAPAPTIPGWRTIVGSGSELGPGLAGLFSAQCKANAGYDEANGARMSAASQADVRLYDEARTDEQGATDSLDKVQQFLNQVEQAENAARLAAATGRA